MARKEHSPDVPKPWPFSEGFEFRKAKKFDERARKKVRELTESGEDAFRIEEKCDGWRVLVAFAVGDQLRCYSRGISEVTGTNIDLMEKFGRIRAVTEMYIGPGDAIECELIWPGRRAAEVPTALKADRSLLEIKAFAMPFEGGKALAPEAQDEALTDLELARPLLFGYAPHLLTNKELDTYAAKRGFEGWMIKSTRSAEPLWFKYKREADADVVVLATKDSQGYLKGTAGMVGSLIVGILCEEETHDDHDCWDLGGHSYREVAAVAGIDDAEREAMTAERDSLVGRVCEIHFAREGCKDRLRHPRFNRWRPDKPAHECLGWDIMDVLEDTE